MKSEEIIELIKVGFRKPKLFKRSTWNKATKIMEFLSSTFKDEIERYNFGPGMEKYKANVIVDNQKLTTWAAAYKNYSEHK